MSAHTPGPWKVEEGMGDGTVTAGPLLIATHQVESNFGNVTFGEVRANARLIAAAPDLLEALEALAASATQGDDKFRASFIAAKAAIQKARGGK